MSLQEQVEDDNNNDVQEEDQQIKEQHQESNNTLSNTSLKLLPYQLLLNACQPLTSAFVSTKKNIPFVQSSTRHKNKNKNSNNNIRYYDQLLISRRSKFRAGTRFTRRGCDGSKRGSVSNFVKTEQICIVMGEDDGVEDDEDEDDGDENDNTTEMHNNGDTIVDELDKKNSSPSTTTTSTTNTENKNNKPSTSYLIKKKPNKSKKSIPTSEFAVLYHYDGLPPLILKRITQKYKLESIH